MDIKDERQQNELEDALVKAEQANRAKTIFLNNMSHDIRTPMNAILGFTNLMEKNLDDRETMEDYIRKIQSSGEYLLMLVNNVLDMAKVESGKMELHEKCVCVELGEKELREAYSNDLDMRGITLSLHTSVQHKYMFVDHLKYRQIVDNLLTNAIKYNRLGGHIDLSFTELFEENGIATCQLAVEDTGIGIREDYLPRIFELFERAHEGDEPDRRGTGLGLAIVKKYVELMQGTIRVESKVGEGTRFTIVMPLRIGTEEDYYQCHREVKNVDTNTFAGKRILLAEDNELNAEIAICILEDAGFQVDHAEDGAICLEMLKQAEESCYSLVLMDIQMPNLNGIEATKAIRCLDDPGKASIPIVAMTASAFEEDRRQALAAGMNGYVSKPIRVAHLLETLEEILAARS